MKPYHAANAMFLHVFSCLLVCIAMATTLVFGCFGVSIAMATTIAVNTEANLMVQIVGTVVQCRY